MNAITIASTGAITTKAARRNSRSSVLICHNFIRDQRMKTRWLVKNPHYAHCRISSQKGASPCSQKLRRVARFFHQAHERLVVVLRDGRNPVDAFVDQLGKEIRKANVFGFDGLLLDVSSCDDVTRLSECGTSPCLPTGAANLRVRRQG